MQTLTLSTIVLAMLALKGAAIFVLAYAGSRLAIRHERRAVH